MVENQFFLADEVVEIETHRFEILLQVVDLLLERDKDAGFTVIGYPTDNKLHRKKCFPAPRAAADKRRSSFREPSTSYIVKTLDP